MSLVDLSLQALIAQAVQKFGVNSITSRTILKLNPEISRIVGIEQNLLEVICNSKHIVDKTCLYLHFVFPSKASSQENTVGQQRNGVLNNAIDYIALLKSDESSEVMIQIQNGIPKLDSVMEFCNFAKRTFGIFSEPIGIKCVCVFKKQCQNISQKIFFVPLRNNTGLKNPELYHYIHHNLRHFKLTIAPEEFTTTSRTNYHMFSIGSYNTFILNWQTCPCQSYICKGGLDNKFSSMLKTCSLFYCDTHPLFTNCI